jgi:TatA/E family protein of Tat protein translocase
MGLPGPDLIVIMIVALIIFGPRKLPELGKKLGEGMAQFRKASDDFKRTWENEVRTEQRYVQPAPRYVQPASPAERESAPPAPVADTQPLVMPADSPETDPAYLAAMSFDTTPSIDAITHVPHPEPAEPAAKETNQDWM